MLIFIYFFLPFPYSTDLDVETVLKSVMLLKGCQMTIHRSFSLSMADNCQKNSQHAESLYEAPLQQHLNLAGAVWLLYPVNMGV